MNANREEEGVYRASLNEGHSDITMPFLTARAIPFKLRRLTEGFTACLKTGTFLF